MASSKKFAPRSSQNIVDGCSNLEKTISGDDSSSTEFLSSTDEGVNEAPMEVATNPSSVTFNPTTDKKPIDRMVKICLAEDFNGCIGGVWYHFKKDQVVSVNENVKRILNSSAGMLKPL